MSSRAPFVVLLAGGALLAGHGCVQPDERAPAQAIDTPTVATPSARPRARFDLADVARRARLAFRRDGGAETWRLSAVESSALVGGVGGSVTVIRAASDARLRLMTRSIARSGAAMAVASSAQVAELEGALSVARGEATEHLAGVDQGLEQSWTFEAAPHGGGPLEVRVRATGLPWRGRTSAGLHFGDDARGGFRYGEASWRDATGKVSAVAASFDGDDIVLSVPAAAVEGAAYPATLDPVIGAEFLVDVPDAGGVAYQHQNAAVAFNGTEYLVVWDTGQGVSTHGVYGARVDLAGTVLDPAGIAIRGVPSPCYKPLVASDGQDFLVAFADASSSSGVVYRTMQVKANGSLVTPTGTSTTPFNANVASLAYGGGGYLLVWDQWSNFYSTYLIEEVPVSTTGTFGATPARFCSLFGCWEQYPAVAWNGTSFLTVWADNRGGPSSLRGAFVSPAGAIADVNGFSVGSQPAFGIAPKVASNGTDFFVGWANGKVYGTRVSAGGATLDPTAIAIAPTATNAASLSVAYDGYNYLLAWEDHRAAGNDIFGTWVSNAGSVLQPGGVDLAPDTADERSPLAAFDGSARGLLVYERLVSGAGSNLRVDARLIGNGAALGNACSLASECASGNCVDGVCCNGPCGGGAVDCLACSVAAGAAQDGRCATANAGAVCRAAAGACDLAESCNGVATTCPPDVLAPAATTCRGAAGACDVAEACSGTSAACPTDAKVPATTTCRAAAGACDVAEACNGVGNDCPPDALAPAMTTCRAAAGACDVAEVCTGSSAACPTDAKAPATTTCRAAAGACDLVEACDGVGSDCPPDALAPATTTCRAAAGACDVAEACTGSSAACPIDAKAPATTTCRVSAGACDVVEACNGVGNDCPPDLLAPATTPCRAAAGACDVAEACTGSSAACPTDAKASAATTCRVAAGACDVAEACNGVGNDCPPDALAPATTTCREAAGACDVAEACTGSSAACPTDAKAPATTTCRVSAGACDVAEACNGVGNDCPPDALAPATTTCRAAAGACDVAEACTGSSAACPTDAKAPATTTCRAAAGACDVAEACDGFGNDCPPDALAPATMTCRAAAGTCDVAEVCTGSSAACPTDAKALATTTCGSPTCAGGSESAAPHCDGSGACAPAAARGCGSYACGATACLASCVGDSDCAVGRLCVGMACVVPSEADAGAGDAADATSIDGGDAGSTSADASDADGAPSSSDADEVGETLEDASSDSLADAADAAVAADAADADLEAVIESDADADLRDSAEVGPSLPAPSADGSGGCSCEVIGMSVPSAAPRVSTVFALLATLVVARRRRRRTPRDGCRTSPQGRR